MPANADLAGMLGRVCVPLVVRGFRVGTWWCSSTPRNESGASVSPSCRTWAWELEQGLVLPVIDPSTGQVQVAAAANKVRGRLLRRGAIRGGGRGGLKKSRGKGPGGG